MTWGIENYTMLLEPKGAKVYLFGSNDALMAKAVETGRFYGSEVSYVKGKGEFIGTRQEGGGDTAQRQDARQVFDRLIRSSKVSGFEGDGLNRIWNGIRDRWGKTFETEVRLSAAAPCSPSGSLLFRRKLPPIPGVICPPIPG